MTGHILITVTGYGEEKEWFAGEISQGEKEI